MPYSYDQCQAFGAKAGRGEAVPKDWQEKCKGVKKPSGSKSSAKKKPTTKKSTKKVKR